jgi:hypothetical protein
VVISKIILGGKDMEAKERMGKVLQEKKAELEKIKVEIEKADKQIAGLNNERLQLAQQGLELQGAVKVLEDLIKE